MESLKLRVVDAAAGQVAFRSTVGRWLSALPNGSLVANRSEVSTWETFTVIPANGAPCDLFLRAHDGRFVSLRGDDVDATVQTAKLTECLTLIDFTVARRAYTNTSPSIAAWGGGVPAVQPGPAVANVAADAIVSLGAGIAAVASAGASAFQQAAAALMTPPQPPPAPPLPCAQRPPSVVMIPAQAHPVVYVMQTPPIAQPVYIAQYGALSSQPYVYAQPVASPVQSQQRGDSIATTTATLSASTRAIQGNSVPIAEPRHSCRC